MISNRTLRPATSVLLVLLAAGAHRPASAQDPLRDFDAYTSDAVAEWGAVGLAVAVVKDGELLFARGYGVRDAEAGGPVDAETLFAIGSTTKAMTAAAIGMLVEEGKLDWDDPVTRHLPSFRLSDPWLTREVTIRDLLTHRAGMGNADFLWYEVETEIDEILERFAQAPVAYSPRSSFIYQNIMYAAAGAVIEAVAGLPWEEFLRSRIFEPLGMTGTVPLLAETVDRPNVAVPHHTVDGELVPIDNASVDPVRAAGSVWSSVSDMSLWLRTLLAGGVAPNGTRILAESTVNELFRPQAFVPEAAYYPTARLTRPNWATYGLGWFQQDYRGRKIDFHTGSIDGMVAIAGLVRDEGLGVYVLGNRDHVEVRHALMLRVFDLFLAPGEVRDWSTELKAMYDALAERAREAAERVRATRIEGTEPTHDLSEYSGVYADSLFGTVNVSRADGGLFIERGPGLRGPLEHWHYDTFVTDWEAGWRGPWTVSFVTDSDGSISGMEVAGRTLRKAR